MTETLLTGLRHYDTGSTWPPYNLALEEALLEALEPDAPGCFLLWQNSPSVIIGRHQNAWTEVNLPVLKELGLPLVRRLTGGGAVYHDLGNLNFSFLLSRPGGRDIRPAELLAPLVAHFQGLGLEVVMEGRNDLTIPGAGKFSGLAARRPPGRYQLHGTLMHRVDLTVLSRVLRVDPEKYRGKGLASVRARVTNLADHLAVDLPSLRAGIQGAYGGPPCPPPQAVQRRAAELAREKYGRDDWNLGQSPPADIFLKKRFAFGALELHLAAKKNRIAEAVITGDFLTPSGPDEPIAVERLAEALIGLPADQPGLWSAAWRGFDFSRIFHGPADAGDITSWLADG